MKLRRDTVTGIVGLVFCVIALVLIQQIRQPVNLLEPGPRLMPYVAVFLIAVTSVAILIQGIKDRDKEEKPYFPKGGVKKIVRSLVLLTSYSLALYFVGFLPSTPFATFAFMYDLKGNSKVKLLTAVIFSIAVTLGLYAMFAFGFQVKLPTGILFE